MIGDTTLTTHRMRYSAAYPMGAERMKGAKNQPIIRVCLQWVPHHLCFSASPPLCVKNHNRLLSNSNS